MEQADAVARRGAAVRRAGDAAVARAGLDRQPHRARWAAPTCACAATRAAAWRSSGFEGEADDVERRRVRAARCCAPGGGLALGRRPGEAWLRGRYARPLPARRPARPRRDAWRRSRPPPPGATCARSTPRWGTRCARSLSERGTPPLVHVPRVAPVPLGRLALLHLPGPPGAGRRRWSSGGRRRRPRATRSWRTAARSRTTTRSAATTRPGWRPRSASSAIDVLRAAKERLDPAGIMNPGKLLPSELVHGGQQRRVRAHEQRALLRQQRVGRVAAGLDPAV